MMSLFERLGNWLKNSYIEPELHTSKDAMPSEKLEWPEPIVSVETAPPEHFLLADLRRDNPIDASLIEGHLPTYIDWSWSWSSPGFVDGYGLRVSSPSAAILS